MQIDECKTFYLNRTSEPCVRDSQVLEEETEAIINKSQIPVNKTKEFNQIFRSKNDIKILHKDINHFKNSIEMLETVLERLPQSILLLSFIFTSQDNGRLRWLLDLQAKSEYYRIMWLTLMVGSTLWGIIFTLINYK